jgi:zinc transporter ZupT
MWQALGGLLPIAVAIAFSSVPITATGFILLSPNRNRTALPFLVGWVFGVAAVIMLSALFASALPELPRRRPDTPSAVLVMIVGVTLIVLGIINLRKDTRSADTGLPRWLSKVESAGALVAFAVAVALNFRPKGLLLGIAAGLALHAASVKAGEAAVLVTIYTAIATSTVAVPIIASFLAQRQVEPKLLAARDWMTQNRRLLTSLLMFAIGVVILGYGLNQL